jgi:hypothetical protein
VALENLRLDGAIFFRAEFTENWAFESPLKDLTQAPWRQEHDPVPHRCGGQMLDLDAQRRKALGQCG